MVDNALMVKPAEIDEDLKKRITEDKELPDTRVLDAEQKAAEEQERDEGLNELFGVDGGIEDVLELYKEDIEKMKEDNKDKITKKESLQQSTKDPFHAEEYEQQHKVFTKEKVDVNNDDGYDPRDTVVGSRYEADSKRSVGTGNYRPTGGKTVSGIYGTGAKSKTQSSYQNNGGSAPKANAGDNINNHAGRLGGNVQNIAMQEIPGWREKDTDRRGWKKGKPTWKKRIKRFFKSKKFRVLTKVGTLMTLQMGLAIAGGKYEMESTGQMMAFLGMMLGIFYISHELAEDGIDPRGMGII